MLMMLTDGDGEYWLRGWTRLWCEALMRGNT